MVRADVSITEAILLHLRDPFLASSSAARLTRSTIIVAEDTLAPLEREMMVMRWPPEFRRIVWEAVARVAANHANEQLGDKSIVGL